MSDAESGVLPILPPEKGRENEHVEKAAWVLPNFPVPPPRACCDLSRVGGPRTGEGVVWKEAWSEGRPGDMKWPWDRVKEMTVVLRD